jgi:YVTN family beta-propeller protein
MANWLCRDAVREGYSPRVLITLVAACCLFDVPWVAAQEPSALVSAPATTQPSAVVPPPRAISAPEGQSVELVVTVNVAGAELLVDGVQVGESSGAPDTFHVGASATRLEVKKPGFSTFARALALTAGNREQVSVSLEPAAAPAEVHNEAWVLLPDAGRVAVINTDTNRVMESFAVGKRPLGIALNTARTLAFVADGTSKTISVVDLARKRVVSVIKLRIRPLLIAVQPGRDRAFVLGGESTVSVIDTARNRVVDSITVGREPNGVAFNPSGTRAYVTNMETRTVSIIDTDTLRIVGTVGLDAQPIAIAVDSSGTYLYVTHLLPGLLSVIETASQKVVASLPVGSTPFNVAVSQSSPRVYVSDLVGNRVYVIDTELKSVVAEIGQIESPTGLAVSADGSRLLVATEDSVSVIDTKTNLVIASIPGLRGAGEILLR